MATAPARAESHLTDLSLEAGLGCAQVSRGGDIADTDIDHPRVQLVEGETTRIAPIKPAPLDEVDTLIGTELHGYSLVRHLGSGAYAHVFEARHRFMKRRCAAKLLRRPDPHQDAIARMFREAELLERVPHPNIVGIENVGYAPDGRPFLLMEFVPGVSLRRLLELTGTMTDRAVRRVAHQVARGLGAAHAVGVVHRDIKPANVLMTSPDDDVKILDFGLARRRSDPSWNVTQPNQVLGTPNYMAPEQIRHPQEVGPATDLYGLGCTMYKLLTGSPPFVGTLEDVIRGHVWDRPAALPNSELSEIVMALLEKRPADRPSAAEAVAQHLSDVPDPPSKPRTTLWERLRPSIF